MNDLVKQRKHGVEHVLWGVGGVIAFALLVRGLGLVLDLDEWATAIVILGFNIMLVFVGLIVRGALQVATGAPWKASPAWLRLGYLIFAAPFALIFAALSILVVVRGWP